MRVIRSGACRNSPKNAFVEQFAIDLLARAELEGRVEDATSLPHVPGEVSMIQILHAISHGKVGAALGRLESGGRLMEFSLFMEFTSTKAAVARKLSLFFARDA